MVRILKGNILHKAKSPSTTSANIFLRRFPENNWIRITFMSDNRCSNKQSIFTLSFSTTNCMILGDQIPALNWWSVWLLFPSLYTGFFLLCFAPGRATVTPRPLDGIITFITCNLSCNSSGENLTMIIRCWIVLKICCFTSCISKTLPGDLGISRPCEGASLCTGAESDKTSALKCNLSLWGYIDIWKFHDSIFWTSLVQKA